MMPRSWNFFQFFFPWYPSSAKPLSWVSHGKKKKRVGSKKVRRLLNYFHPSSQDSVCSTTSAILVLHGFFHGWGFGAHLDRTAGTASRFIVTRVFRVFWREWEWLRGDASFGWRGVSGAVERMKETGPTLFFVFFGLKFARSSNPRAF